MTDPSWLHDVATIDVESLPIAKRPDYPPPLVGVAVKIGAGRPVYHAFGHGDGNTCTWADARRVVGEIYDSGRPILWHNCRFDVDAIELDLGLKVPRWGRLHDTIPLLFLDDPRAPSMSLKPSAERLLGEPPAERDEVVQWLVDHQPVPSVKLTANAKAGETDGGDPKYAGAYVGLAPVSLVGPYACGDVDRTWRLAEKLYPSIVKRGMEQAYDRERRLLPVLLEMERQGVRVGVENLRGDVLRYLDAMAELEVWLRRRLQAGDSLNLDSGDQLVKALVDARVAKVEDFGTTDKGKVQTNKDALMAAVKDPTILAALKYRTQLGTCLDTFMRPWLATAERSGGLIYTTWNSTRVDRGGGMAGTRTGRLSSTPNFQNIPKEFKQLWADDKNPALPQAPVVLPPLPLCRGYLVPMTSDEVIIDRDYSQQELRVLAHFEGGALQAAYVKDPWLDLHEFARQLINSMLGTSYERKVIKNTGFGLIYGMGVGSLAERNGTDVAMAKAVKDAYLKTFPGLKDMYAEMKRRAKDDEPIYTWGGREYYVEPPKIIHNRLCTYDYKMVNVLVQGSSACISKEALLRYAEAKPAHHRVMLTVHDEFAVSVPKAEQHQAMSQLRKAMESIELSVPLFSDGKSGKTLATMTAYDKVGKRLDGLPWT